MSTTPQGSASNQDEITLVTTTTATTLTVSEPEHTIINEDSDSRRHEAFDLPKSKKFKSSTTLISNGSDPTIMSSNNNSTNLVEPMEHTNGEMNYNGNSENNNSQTTQQTTTSYQMAGVLQHQTSTSSTKTPEIDESLYSRQL
ncbi:unnamed protein product [Rotaria sp. Silwood1]|nr:unnamed protein product [Rotaria sp. Silwood1]CAF1617160.1 unnamed protein product [Rotaria sp. Silwood1]